MSAFVKGLKKPPACIYYDSVRKETIKCQCLTEHDTCCLHDEKTKSKLSRASWDEQYALCPITDIPTPHGDLLDRNDLLDEINLMYPFNSPEYSVVFDMVSDMDAVIEKEAIK